MARTDTLTTRKRRIMLAASARWTAHRAEREVAAASLSALGPGAADTALKRDRFFARRNILGEAALLRERGDLPLAIERKIGPTLDFMRAAPSEAARRVGRPVARLVGSCDPGIEAEGFATGFLVHPGLLLTNWHVFPDKASASGVGANFLYELGDRGVGRGLIFPLEPERFFVSHERLDFALVAVASRAVDGALLDELGFVAPSGAIGKILIGQPINIIQHPDGGAKQYATRDNRLVDILEEGFLHYATDTLEGSSGSPAFSEVWELVGLHHAGVPEVKGGKIMSRDGIPWTEEMGDEAVNWVANEGVRISAIVRALSETRLADRTQAALLEALLASTVDPAMEIEELRSGGGATAAGLPAAARAIEVVPGLAQATFHFPGPVTIQIVSAVASADLSAIALEKSIRFDPDYGARKGFDPAFLGDRLAVSLPAVTAARDGEMYKVDGRIEVLNYHHYSLAMNRARRLLMWSAANVDYDPAQRATGGRANFGSDRWIGDPRIPADVQFGDREFYGPAKQIDRGHIVRRQDNAWGADPREVEFANSDTFHWTNCTPQHGAFNRAAAPTRYQRPEGLWGAFEVYVQRELMRDELRACILAGPVLAGDDPVADFGAGPIAYPVDFWKVVVVAEKTSVKRPRVRAFGFMMSQRDVVEQFGIEFAPGRYTRFRKSLAEISDVSGVIFDKALLRAEAAIV